MADILAFDFGMRRIGVAVGNDQSGQVSPLEVLPARAGRPEWRRVQALVDRWQPALVVVGLPLNMDGSESCSSSRARRFADELRRRYDLSPQMHDERLSSMEAREMGAEAGARAAVDALAACVILRSWLDARG